MNRQKLAHGVLCASLALLVALLIGNDSTLGAERVNNVTAPKLAAVSSEIASALENRSVSKRLTHSIGTLDDENGLPINLARLNASSGDDEEGDSSTEPTPPSAEETDNSSNNGNTNSEEPAPSTEGTTEAETPQGETSTEPAEEPSGDEMAPEVGNNPEPAEEPSSNEEAPEAGNHSVPTEEPSNDEDAPNGEIRRRPLPVPFDNDGPQGDEDSSEMSDDPSYDDDTSREGIPRRPSQAPSDAEDMIGNDLIEDPAEEVQPPEIGSSPGGRIPTAPDTFEDEVMEEPSSEDATDGPQPGLHRDPEWIEDDIMEKPPGGEESPIGDNVPNQNEPRIEDDQAELGFRPVSMDSLPNYKGAQIPDVLLNPTPEYLEMNTTTFLNGTDQILLIYMEAKSGEIEVLGQLEPDTSFDMLAFVGNTLYVATMQDGTPTAIWDVIVQPGGLRFASETDVSILKLSSPSRQLTKTEQKQMRLLQLRLVKAKSVGTPAQVRKLQTQIAQLTSVGQIRFIKNLLFVFAKVPGGKLKSSTSTSPFKPALLTLLRNWQNNWTSKLPTSVASRRGNRTVSGHSSHRTSGLSPRLAGNYYEYLNRSKTARRVYVFYGNQSDAGTYREIQQAGVWFAEKDVSGKFRYTNGILKLSLNGARPISLKITPTTKSGVLMVSNDKGKRLWNRSGQ